LVGIDRTDQPSLLVETFLTPVNAGLHSGRTAHNCAFDDRWSAGEDQPVILLLGEEFGDELYGDGSLTGRLAFA